MVIIAYIFLGGGAFSWVKWKVNINPRQFAHGLYSPDRSLFKHLSSWDSIRHLDCRSFPLLLSCIDASIIRMYSRVYFSWFSFQDSCQWTVYPWTIFSWVEILLKRERKLGINLRNPEVNSFLILFSIVNSWW